MANMVIFGGSRGLGSALAVGLPRRGDKVWVVSRSRPASLTRSGAVGSDVAGEEPDDVQRIWIQADLSQRDGIANVTRVIGDEGIDVLIYNAGIWETKAFTALSDAEIHAIIDTNLTSLLVGLRHLLDNLRKSAQGKIILIGSTCGLENEGARAVVYVATKFGMRGAAQAIREVVRDAGIAVTCLSPGSMATDLSYTEGREAALTKHQGARIPVQDIVDLVRSLLSLSPAACVKDITIPAVRDTDV